MKQNLNELALHLSAPETAPQLPQQQAEEPAKRPDKKPKKRSRLGSQNLASGSYSCQRHSVGEVAVVQFLQTLGTTGRRKKK